uniref:Putative secreted protein n=2 Tax=albitarsis series TaxID=58233 RepID=A0A2M4CFN5_9DIPT
MSSPCAPPYCLASFSISCFSSRSMAGEASTSLPPALWLFCAYSRSFVTNSCWMGSLAFASSTADTP